MSNHTPIAHAFLCWLLGAPTCGALASCGAAGLQVRFLVLRLADPRH